MVIMNKPKLIRITPQSHEDWLELRRQGIGGSDAAAVAGVSTYSSPYMVWVDKMGQKPDVEPSEAIIQGVDLEEYVAERFCRQTGKKVRKRTQILKNPKYPFAHANVDRWIVGENAGLECKTTSSMNMKRFKDKEFPVEYYFQCMHYMAVTGAEKFYLAVLIFSKDFLIFEIERDEELIENLMKVEREFWEYVTDKTPPPVDGAKATDNALLYHYDTPTEDEVQLMCERDVSELVALKAKKKELDQAIKEKEQLIKDKLGNAERGYTDNYKVSWKPQMRRTFDYKRFQQDHDDVDLEPYYKESQARVFRVKKLIDN